MSRHTICWPGLFTVTPPDTRRQTANDPESSTAVDTPLLAGSKTPQPVFTIFQRACQDCHSANTNWPWYSQISPISWRIHEDVAQGRKFMDLSRWDTYTDSERRG